jgi:hypothetical protein
VEKPREVILYWPRGLVFWQSKAVYAKGSMLEGQRHGPWTFWYKQGGKQLAGEYVRGKKTGLWVRWNPNGSRATEGEFLYGKMHGKWTDWHGNGNKALQSHWVMGKRDGQWTYWNAEGTLEKTVMYDHHVEEDKGYSIYTDLETKQLIRDIQKRHVHGTWERLVGRSVAKFVKPWHVSCWALIFIPLLAFIKDKAPWQRAILAAVLAFVVTGLVAWCLESRSRHKEQG